MVVIFFTHRGECFDNLSQNVGRVMVDRANQLLKLRESDLIFDEIMDVFSEAAKIHEQALIAMGQQSVVARSTVASSKVVMNLVPDISSREDYR